MADRIIPPMQPDVLDPEPHHRIEGDWSDDDGSALDQYFEPNPQGPNLIGTETLLTNQPTYDDTPPKITRLLTRSVPLNSASAPLQLFPADPLRKRLRIRALSAGPYVQVANPAAGAGVTYTIGAGAPRRLVSVTDRLVTSATVATRSPYLQFTRNGILQAQSVLNSTAASTNVFSYWLANSAVVTGTDAGLGTRYGQAPTELLKPGDLLTLNVLAIDATDQLSSVAFAFDADSWRLAGEQGDCFGAGDMRTDQTYESDCHTGPVWVYAPNALDSMTIIAESLTE